FGGNNLNSRHNGLYIIQSQVDFRHLLIKSNDIIFVLNDNIISSFKPVKHVKKRIIKIGQSLLIDIISIRTNRTNTSHRLFNTVNDIQRLTTIPNFEKTNLKAINIFNLIECLRQLIHN